MEYEILDHTADIKIRVRGCDLKELLENAARAMMDISVSGDSVVRRRAIDFSVRAETPEELLVKLLGEILYLGEVNKMVFNGISLSLNNGYEACGRLSGEEVDAGRHEFLNDLKAVTYHDLKIEKSGDTLIADIIFDI